MPRKLKLSFLILTITCGMWVFKNIFNFFLDYGLCELFVLFGLTSCRLFVNSILIGYSVYPSLNLQTSEAVLLIESINNSQFILMIFSLIERIF